MSFNIGEEVICVDNGQRWDYPCSLVKGKTYIVLEHCPDGCCIAVKPNDFFWTNNRFRRPQVDEVQAEAKRGSVLRIKLPADYKLGVDLGHE